MARQGADCKDASGRPSEKGQAMTMLSSLELVRRVPLFAMLTEAQALSLIHI